MHMCAYVCVCHSKYHSEQSLISNHQIMARKLTIKVFIPIFMWMEIEGKAIF